MNTDLAMASALKVTCSRDELAAALGIAARGLSTRSAVQVLTGILLQPQDGKLTLAATDMELSLRASVTGDVEGDGAVAVPGGLLAALGNPRPAHQGVFSYEPSDGVLAVPSGSYSSKVNV